jgi:hypothetical protein
MDWFDRSKYHESDFLLRRLEITSDASDIAKKINQNSSTSFSVCLSVCLSLYTCIFVA